MARGRIDRKKEFLLHLLEVRGYRGAHLIDVVKHEELVRTTFVYNGEVHNEFFSQVEILEDLTAE